MKIICTRERIAFSLPKTKDRDFEPVLPKILSKEFPKSNDGVIAPVRKFLKPVVELC